MRDEFGKVGGGESPGALDALGRDGGELRKPEMDVVAVGVVLYRRG